MPHWQAEAKPHHSRYYGKFLYSREGELRGRLQVAILHEIWNEIDNIRSGWRWAVEHCQIGIIDNYLKSFQWVTAIRGWNQSMVEEFAWAADLLTRHLASQNNADSRREIIVVLAKTLHCQAQHAIFLGLLIDAQRLCTESLAQLVSVQTDEATIAEAAYVRLTLALALFDQGRYEESERACRQAWPHFQANNDMVGVSWTLWLLGLNHMTLGQHREAEGELEQSRAIAKQMGDLWGQAWAEGMLCSLYITKGDYQQAELCALESYRIRQQFNHRLGIAYSLLNLGEIALAQQRRAIAHERYEEALTIGKEINDPHVKGACLRELGKIAQMNGDLYQARRMYSEALLVFQGAGRQADVELIQRELALASVVSYN